MTNNEPPQKVKLKGKKVISTEGGQRIEIDNPEVLKVKGK